MTEQEVRRYLRQMKDESSEQAFRGFYDLTYDRLFRIAYYYVKREEWAQEIVLDVFMRLWDQRKKLPEINNIEDYCFILTKNASLNYLEKEAKHMPQFPDSCPSQPTIPILPKKHLSAMNFLPAMSKPSTVYRNVAGKYLSEYAKRNKVMPR